jgi:hypothetical protein
LTSTPISTRSSAPLMQSGFRASYAVSRKVSRARAVRAGKLVRATNLFCVDCSGLVVHIAEACP